MYVAQAFNPRSNALNSLRLLFAIVVIVAHTFPIGGFGPSPHLGDFELGGFAVACFFVASGYLISKSRRRNSFGRYMWARFLRIYPAFWASLLITAFVFSLVAGLMRGGWTLSSAASYCIKNVTLRMEQWTIGGTLDHSPYTLAWNGSLWTLYHEFGCYVIVGVILLVPFLRRSRWTLTVVFVATTILALANHFSLVGVPTAEAALWAILAPFFFAGCVLADFEEGIPANWILFAACVVVVVVSTAFGWGRVFAPLPLAYCVILLGARVPRVVERWGSGTNDISYGMYVYVFPIQQLLVFTIFGHNLVVMAVAATVLTLIPAIASWYLLEKPAMQLKTMAVPSALQRTSWRSRGVVAESGTVDGG